MLLRRPLWLLLFLVLTVGSANGKEKDVIWKVPVFYVTDRNPTVNVSQGAEILGYQAKKPVYGPKRLLEQDTISGLHSGVVEITVPIKAGAKLTEWQKTGLPLTTCAALELPKVQQFAGDSALDLNKKFDKQLSEALAMCSRKEVFVFVHGFNNSFNVAALNAAKLSYYSGCPVILYSWPSAEKVYRYSLDECNNEWSQEHFNQFIEHMIGFKKSQNLKCNLVCHSMGNRLFIRGMQLYAGSALFTDIYMVNPDFDAQTFVHYLVRCLPKNGLAQGVRGQFLISRKDKALSISEGIFGGYTRLGQGADFTLGALMSPDLFAKVWGQSGNIINQYTSAVSDPGAAGVTGSSATDPKTSVDIVSDKDSAAKQAEAKRIASIASALRVVDVTCFDYSMIGHKVPHEYIAWNHYANTPPSGYKIVEDTSEAMNRVAKMFARACGQKITKPVGKYLIVMPIDDCKQAKNKTADKSPVSVAK